MTEFRRDAPELVLDTVAISTGSIVASWGFIVASCGLVETSPGFITALARPKGFAGAWCMMSFFHWATAVMVGSSTATLTPISVIPGSGSQAGRPAYAAGRRVPPPRPRLVMAGVETV